MKPANETPTPEQLRNTARAHHRALAISHLHAAAALAAEALGQFTLCQEPRLAAAVRRASHARQAIQDAEQSALDTPITPEVNT